MEAFGKPGIAPTWSSSDKDLIGTALSTSRLWFTMSHGIINEVFWPATGEPQIRDLGFLVAGDGFWAEVKRVNRYTLTTPNPATPLPVIIHEHERYRLTLRVVPDPDRDVLLIAYRLEGDGMRLYPLLAPHLGGSGWGNTAWVAGEALLAQKGQSAVALVGRFLRGSAGYVGFSDGWQDMAHNGRMTWTFDRAEDGNVALMGELAEPEGVLALAFATTPDGAVTLARSSLADGIDRARSQVLQEWRRFTRGIQLPSAQPDVLDMVKRSLLVLKAHEDRTYPGAMVASLSIPWGNSRDDPGGYHLVWTRDAVEAGLAFLALGLPADARRQLAYLSAIQATDGHWPQNVYPDGRPYWTGIQLDETAFPVLLAAKLAELGHLSGLIEPVQAMVRRAVGFLAREGPCSPQDRWEENAGINPFTLAATIAALAASALLGLLDGDEAAYALDLADDWNQRIEEWTYVEDTLLDRAHGIRGHYVRIRPPGALGLRGRVDVHNRQGVILPAAELIGLEFLSLVRFGLRAPDDPRIRDTVRLVDAILRVDTPSGPFYHRYNDDGYGEHADGRPFDGTGIGRAWPLLSGERGHYALVAGEDPLPYLFAMIRGAGKGGLIPEQVWDSDPIPDQGLFPGKPTGSAMPLLWAHAEFVKLVLALSTGKPIEQLAAVAERYRVAPKPRVRHWRRDVPLDSIGDGERLLIEDRRPFQLHVGVDGWQHVTDRASQPLPFGLHGVEVELGEHASLEFTFFFPDENRWEGRDYQVRRATAMT